MDARDSVEHRHNHYIRFFVGFKRALESELLAKDASASQSGMFLYAIFFA